MGFSGRSDVTRSQPESITLSSLFFGSDETSKFFINNAVTLFVDFARRNPKFECVAVLRSNSPRDDIRKIDRALSSLRREAPANCVISLERSGHNLGFGQGHNANYAVARSDLLVVANNDVVLSDLAFLDEAINLFSKDGSLAAVGAGGQPGRLRETTVSAPPKDFPPALTDYLEASLIVYRGSAFAEAGGFSAKFGYAYYEDGDLCLRLIEAGHKVQSISIEHMHVRGVSAATVPTHALVAEHEHNRATFNARWNGYLRTGSRPGVGVIDLRADGVGDVVYALRPIFDFLQTVPSVEVSIVLNGPRCAYLFEGLPARLIDGRRLDVVAEAELRRAASSFWCDCRRVVHSAPFLSQDLMYASLGIQPDRIPNAQFEAWRGDLKERLKAPAATALASGPAGYAVLHIDSQRGDFEGRSPPPSAFASLAARMAAEQPVALIGQTMQDAASELEVGRLIEACGLVDLRDCSLETTTAVVANARRYVGIDSGPMHLAQLFDVPSAIVFGSTLPSTKVIDRSRVQPIVHHSLDCIGCYHKQISAGYAYCMRRDQACVTTIEADRIAQEASRFFETGHADWSASDAAARRIEAGWLRLMMHHPHLRTEALLATTGGVKAVVDQVTNLTERIYDRAEQSLVTIATALEKRVADDAIIRRELEADVKRLMQERSALTHALMGSGLQPAADAGAKPLTPKTGRLTRLDLLKSAAVTSRVKKGELERMDTGLAISGNEHPQLIFALDAGVQASCDAMLCLSVRTRENGFVEIYHAGHGQPFVKHRRTKRKILKGDNVIDLIVAHEDPIRSVRVDFIVADCRVVVTAASLLAVSDAVSQARSVNA